MAQDHYGIDGALDRVLRLGQKQKLTPAIFIHAGAGFHSRQNERLHLKACVSSVPHPPSLDNCVTNETAASAAEMGMRFLKAGATATEAVEAALRILEDKEITNAGFGSNLSIDGLVECDATIVDHLGRSGACGAVPNIRNPISLAKLILDTSNMPLTLRRVPPNTLVGEGARAFAEEHGLPTFANEYLVSRNSHDRFYRWQEDLMRAEGRIKDVKLNSVSGPKVAACVPCQYETAPPVDHGGRLPREHAAAIQAGTWNEGQPDSPYAGTPIPEPSNMPDSTAFAGHVRPMAHPLQRASRSSLHNPVSSSPSAPGTFPGGEQRGGFFAQHSGGDDCANSPAARRTKNQGDSFNGDGDFDRSHDGSATPLDRFGHLGFAGLGNTFGLGASRGLKRPHSAAMSSDFQSVESADDFPDARDDFITDTIGAIVIDEHGQIAAGSSSGGIGMKHRGRLGPAALVGIGTAVVPSAEKDEEGITVATVTSGTGEHMATTMASQRCAERIYQGTRRGPRGFDIREDDEDAIMESFIADDFMNHPGVRNCYSAGAIGVMAVKKSRAGYYFYFAHNTDSFALASMGGFDREPLCTMSRLAEGCKIARGGRKIQAS